LIESDLPSGNAAALSAFLKLDNSKRATSNNFGALQLDSLHHFHAATVHHRSLALLGMLPMLLKNGRRPCFRMQNKE
jgi:hypothetical protein